jgi:pimeloyl-ACP methyl ester carboxylesterase
MATTHMRWSLRGHEHSPAARSLLTTALGDYVADVVGVAGRLSRLPVLVGQSMGGLVVQLALARGAPARAGGLLASAPPRGILGATLRLARRHPLAFAEVNLTLRLWPIVRTPALARDSLLRPTATEAEATALHARLQDESYRAFLGMLLPGLDPSRVTVPMLDLGGAPMPSSPRRRSAPRPSPMASRQRSSRRLGTISCSTRPGNGSRVASWSGSPRRGFRADALSEPHRQEPGSAAHEAESYSGRAKTLIRMASCVIGRRR